MAEQTQLPGVCTAGPHGEEDHFSSAHVARAQGPLKGKYTNTWSIACARRESQVGTCGQLHLPSGRGQFAVGDDPALENGLSPSPFMALGEALGLRMPACKLGLKPCLPGPLVRPTHQWSSWRPRSWFRHPTLHLAGGNPDICHHLRFVLKSERDIFLLGESVHLSKQVTFLGPYKF